MSLSGSPGGRARLACGPIQVRLRHLARLVRGGDLTVGMVVDRLGPESLALALFTFGLLALLPIPGPNGAIFGSMIALVALQVLFGARSLWLPESLRRRPAPSRMLRTAIATALPYAARVETALEESRLAGLTGRRARVLMALPLLAMAAIIILPIPLGNMVPALAILSLAVGFIARDGLAVLVGLGLGLAALVWTGALVLLGAELVKWLAALLP